MRRLLGLVKKETLKYSENIMNSSDTQLWSPPPPPPTVSPLTAGM